MVRWGRMNTQQRLLELFAEIPMYFHTFCPISNRALSYEMDQFCQLQRAVIISTEIGRIKRAVMPQNPPQPTSSAYLAYRECVSSLRRRCAPCYKNAPKNACFSCGEYGKFGEYKEGPIYSGGYLVNSLISLFSEPTASLSLRVC